MRSLFSSFFVSFLCAFASQLRYQTLTALPFLLSYFEALYTMITLFFATMTDPSALENSSASVSTSDLDLLRPATFHLVL